MIKKQPSARHPSADVDTFRVTFGIFVRTIFIGRTMEIVAKFRCEDGHHHFYLFVALWRRFARFHCITFRIVFHVQLFVNLFFQLIGHRNSSRSVGVKTEQKGKIDWNRLSRVKLVPLYGLGASYAAIVTDVIARVIITRCPTFKALSPTPTTSSSSLPYGNYCRVLYCFPLHFLILSLAFFPLCLSCSPPKIIIIIIIMEKWKEGKKNKYKKNWNESERVVVTCGRMRSV